MKKNTKPNLCLDKINLTIFYLEKKYYFCPLHTSSCRAILIQVCSNFHSKTQPEPFRQPQCSPISQLPPDWTLESDPHCGKGTTPSRTVGSEPGSESLVHTAWGEKPIPLSFLAHRNVLCPSPSITADSQPCNVSHAAIASVPLSPRSFSLTNILHFLQNNDGVHKIFHPPILFPAQWNAVTEELFAHHYTNTAPNLSF